MCCACRRRAPKAQLARFVAVGRETGTHLERDDGSVHPGRGVYVCRTLKCFEMAVERRAFARGLRAGGAVIIDPVLADTVAEGNGERD